MFRSIFSSFDFLAGKETKLVSQFPVPQQHRAYSTKKYRVNCFHLSSHISLLLLFLPIIGVAPTQAHENRSAVGLWMLYIGAKSISPPPPPFKTPLVTVSAECEPYLVDLATAAAAANDVAAITTHF